MQHDNLRFVVIEFELMLQIPDSHFGDAMVEQVYCVPVSQTLHSCSLHTDVISILVELYMKVRAYVSSTCRILFQHH